MTTTRNKVGRSKDLPLRMLVAVIVCTMTAVAAAQRWTPPRMSWGDPDLEGVWTSDNNFSIPLERPAAVADKEFLDGKELEDELARRARRIEGVRVGGE